jgi:hypothetical protein
MNINQLIVATDPRGRKIVESYPFDRYEREIRPGSRIAFQDGDGQLCLGKVRVVKKKRRPLINGKPANPSSWQALVSRGDGSDAKLANVQKALVLEPVA